MPRDSRTCTSRDLCEDPAAMMGTIRRVGEAVDRASPKVQRGFYVASVLAIAVFLLWNWLAHRS